MSMARIRCEDVTKSYGAVTAVSRLTLDIADREFMVFLGPSGCGKTTTLNVIAGLEQISEGDIWFDDRRVTLVPPHRREIAMVFQSYALYPNMSVAENIAFGMEMRGVPKAERDKAVAAVARTLQIEHLLSRRPSQLSGGQRQRVAMGRALVRHPRAFLMDEPLSNLDARLRGQMRVEIARLQRAAGVTTVYVTHDQVEAMTMADRVAVMRDGVLQQLGAPRELYDRPGNLFVATFIGAPPLNLLAAALRSTGEEVELELPGARVALPPGLAQERPGLAAFRDRNVIVGVRPEAAFLAEHDASGLPGLVAFQEDLGANMVTTVELSQGKRAEGAIVEHLDEFGVPSISSRMRIVAQSGERLRANQPVRVVLDPGRLHFFDPVSKLAIS